MQGVQGTIDELGTPLAEVTFVVVDLETTGLSPASARICEIGGGLGQVAYYAWLRGVRHYTIVDLPSVCAMQYFYLRRALPNVSVRLGNPSGPHAQQEGINLLFAMHLNSSPPVSANIVLNCD
jgi:hypothetical protein